jgi:hypothetical protein
MARFGRGQPHGPIVLRGAIAAAVVATATGSPIHVASLVAERLPRPKPVQVTVLRNPLVPPVVIGSAPKSHVVLAPLPSIRHSARDADIILLRNALAPLGAPKFHIALASSIRHPARDADIILLRNPLTPATVAGAPKFHIIGLPDRRQVRRGGTVVILRNEAPIVSLALALVLTDLGDDRYLVWDISAERYGVADV